MGQGYNEKMSNIQIIPVPEGNGRKNRWKNIQNNNNQEFFKLTKPINPYIQECLRTPNRINKKKLTQKDIHF